MICQVCEGHHDHGRDSTTLYGVAPHWNVYPVKCGHPEVAESEWLRGEPRMDGWEGPGDGTQWMLRPWRSAARPTRAMSLGHRLATHALGGRLFSMNIVYYTRFPNGESYSKKGCRWRMLMRSETAPRRIVTVPFEWTCVTSKGPRRGVLSLRNIP